VSDALKKAAQSLGIGLYLARTEEAMELEAEQSAPAPAQEQPKQSALYEQFMNLRKSLDEDGVAAIRSFWAEYSGGRPVPKAGEFTDDELNALIAECTRISFGGTWVDED
jgi:hypothetical protein